MKYSGFDESTPIYIQIMDKIKLQIISGDWKPEDRIPSVRALSAKFGVNPNTMQRSLIELEREGLLFSDRTAGRFVTKNNEVIIETKAAYTKNIIEKFVKQMQNLGYTKEEIAKIILEVRI